MITSDFKKLYSQLNTEQKQAVDAIEGPVMVIAGPGTGKTQILTLRIANILQKTDTEPEAILAVTFTEAGVIAMRKRLAEITGSTAYNVTITTFHGFAQSAIQQYPEYFPRIIGSLNIAEPDQIRIFEDIIENVKGLKILRPYGDRLHYLRDIMSAIQTLKREGMDVDYFSLIIDQTKKTYDPEEIKTKAERIKIEKQIEKNRELAIIYKQYQTELTRQKLYDFDDMIMETLSAMRGDSDLLLQLQERYQYVLVDEHQDTNNAQNRILELLMSYHDNPNLFIVGDEKQAIFRFQGASLENFNYFKNKFSEAKLITLTENYRSTQSILDAVETKLKAIAGHKEKKIQIIESSTADTELYFVGKKIKELKTPLENIAVLYRDNRDAFPLSRMLEKLEIPFHIESDIDITSDPDIKKLIKIFNAINHFGNLEALIPALYLDIWNIEPIEVHKFFSGETAQFGTSGFTALKTAFPEIYKKFSSWTTIAHNKTPLEFFDVVVSESGLLKKIISRNDSVDALEKLGVFLDQIHRMLEANPAAALADFMDRLERMDRHKMSIKGALFGSHPGKVRLMTAHRSKGLEFDHVFVINAYDGHWGNRRHIEKLKLLPAVYNLAVGPLSDDDRNLFYVAVTRARKTVCISYAQLSLEQRELLPSQFIGELKPEMVEYADAGTYENDFKKHREILFAMTSHNIEPDVKDRKYLQELFLRRGFAVTHLNNYLECPWKYFYINLLRVPKTPEAPQMYGSAIHQALNDVLKGETPQTKKYLISQFKKHLAVRPLSEREKEDFEERGVKALGEYFDKYSKTWTHPVLTEFKIKGIEFSSNIVLTGNLDKVELLGNGDVIVADYKTGKPKSRNEIMGKTRAGDASYYRQLVFYNLLLNEHKNGMYKMKAGEIDFVEHGRKERFEISPEDIASLKKEIRRVADEILNLKFWGQTCKQKDCQWCGLSI